jgi:hypothetical protein
MLERIQHPDREAQQIYLPFRLIVRDSSRAPEKKRVAKKAASGLRQTR